MNHTTMDSAAPQEQAYEDPRQRLLREKADLLVRQTRSGAVGALVSTAAFSGILSTRVPWHLVVVWAGLMVLGYVLRDVIIHRVARATSHPERVIAVSLVSSAVLGFFNTLPAPLFFPQLEPSMRALFTGVLVGWVSVAVQVVGMQPRIYMLYLLVSFGNLAAGWFLAESRDAAWGLTAIMVVAGLILIRFSLRLSELFEESILIRHEKGRLVFQLERALAETESAQRTRLRFLAAASHDLLQPVHALMLLSGLLQNAEPERQPELGARIRMTAESVEAMFRGILELARMDAGTLHAQRRVVALAPICHAVQAAYEARCHDRDLKLHVACPDNLAAWGDPALLDRVMRNLVDNAVKFTQTGSVAVTCSAHDHQVNILITDTGAGIEPDDLPQIYDPFYRGRSAREAEVDGLGLGLAITAHMVHLMGGTIAVDSVRGVGTTVRLQLSRAAMVAPVLAARATRQRRTLRYRRVVLLEDDRLAREATLMWLIEYGAQVISAADVERALIDCRARRFAPDFILADFRLGVSDNGIESIKRLRAEFGTCPAAIVTGEEVPLDALPEDVTMLRKPLKPEQLEELLS